MKLKLYLALITILIFNKILPAQMDTLTILHVNDSHSCLAPLGPRTQSFEGTQGGISRAATLIGMTRMTEQNVLLLHSGDVFIGDLFFNKYFGTAEFQLMNSLGFDAMTVGNHEFDLTPAILDTALRNSFQPGDGFPLLSANLILDDPQVLPLKDYIFPYTIKQFGNVKVGIFGLTTPETNYFSLPLPAVVDTNIVWISLAMIDTLNNLGCNLIICLSHLGIYYDQQLASNIPGIDIIISGHDHFKTETPIEVVDPIGSTTYIVQADAFYKYMGKIKLSVSANEVELINYQLIPLDENVPEDLTIKLLIDGLISEIENTFGPVYSAQIGTATDFFEEVAHNLEQNGPHDTPIGNLVTDAFRWKTQTDVAITVGGSTAQPIYQGPLVAADAFRVVGYGFNDVNGLGYRLVKFQLTGEDLIKGLEFGLSGAELNDELFPQVSGMNYTYNLANPVGSRITSVLINGVNIDPGSIYSITTNEFLVYALGDPSIVQTNINIIDPYLYTDSTEFQVLNEYINSLQTISPEQRGSVVAGIKMNDDKILPQQFVLEQNYPNPFNPTTTIRFRIAELGLVKINVYNILGEEVITLVDEYKATGTYEVEWEASNFPSGVYFYQLSVENKFFDVKKMVILK